MAQFVLFLREDTEKYKKLSPEEMQKVVQEHVGWANKLREENRFVAGDGLKTGGRMMTVKDGRVTDGPFTETKDVIGGYYVIDAADFDQAVAISRECPALKMGDTVEVRQIMDY
jgi:hypothetical protein